MTTAQTFSFATSNNCARIAARQLEKLGCTIRTAGCFHSAVSEGTATHVWATVPANVTRAAQLTIERWAFTSGQVL